MTILQTDNQAYFLLFMIITTHLIEIYSSILKNEAVSVQCKRKESISLLQAVALNISPLSCSFPFNLAVVCCCINNGLGSHLWAIVAFHGAELWPSGCCCRRQPRSQTHEPTRGLRSRRRALTGRYPRIVVFDSSWTAHRNLTLKFKHRGIHWPRPKKNDAYPENVTTKTKLKPHFGPGIKHLYMSVSVRFDMLHVFSIHNEVLQNACSLHILLDSPTTCINNSAIAKRFQRRLFPGLLSE